MDVGGKLTIVNITPDTSVISITSTIKILFNLSLNTKTLTNNVLLLRDRNYKYLNTREIMVDKEDIVDCNLSYSNMELTIRPKIRLNTGERYVLYINGVKDIEGNVIKDFKRSFYTDSIGDEKIEILQPDDGKVFQCIPDIKIKGTEDVKYLIEISKDFDFNVLDIEEIVELSDENDYTISLTNSLEDGLYYYRVKGFTTSFSDKMQFFIKTVIDEKTNEEDEKEFIDYNYEDEVLFVKKEFDNSNIEIDTNTKVISFVLQGKYSIDDIDEFESYLSYNKYLFDEKNIDVEVIPNGTWVTIYDESKDITYISFILDNLEDNTEVEDVEQEEGDTP